jgi:hypothetical protein
VHEITPVVEEAASDTEMAALPRTASPLPLLGIGGLLAMGFGALLTTHRIRRR